MSKQVVVEKYTYSIVDRSEKTGTFMVFNCLSTNKLL